MTGESSLGGLIQRKTAEIESWPSWARAYEPDNSSPHKAPGPSGDDGLSEDPAGGDAGRDRPC
jgi:hypothetical protein